jgi:hypothetical protein
MADKSMRRSCRDHGEHGVRGCPWPVAHGRSSLCLVASNIITEVAALVIGTKGVVMETIRDLLSSQPFLTGLSPAHLDQLVPWSKTSVSPLGARIFEEGRQAQRFWLIRDGRVSLETQGPSHRAVVVESLGRGGVLGWSWLFPPYRWHFSASAGEVMSVIEFDAAGVRELCARPRAGLPVGHPIHRGGRRPAAVHPDAAARPAGAAVVTMTPPRFPGRSIHTR